MKLLTLIVALSFGFGVRAQSDIKMITLDELGELVKEENDQLKVINFWASWCGPCIEELPYFQSLNDQSNVTVSLVSLDFPSDLNKAEKLLKLKDIQLKAFLLDEPDADKFITSIDENWSGAIPATLFVSPKGRTYFYESALKKQELDIIINKLKNND